MPHSKVVMTKTMRGQHSEFIAAAWLIRVLKLDVKTVSIRRSGPKKGCRINRVTNMHQKKIGVKLLYVYKDGRCDWYGKN